MRDDILLTPTPARQVLDADGAIGRFLGNRQLYQELLNTFLSLHAKDSEKLRMSFSLGRIDEARRLLHSLRGAAVIVGAEELADVAEAVSRRLYAADYVEPETSEMLEALSCALHSALAAAQAHVA
jgi:HPt (histidine-containing phosphotransfer) domain-containing protein